MTEDQIRELFREMRDEPVPPDSQARVRMAVAERTQSWPERLRRRWRWMAGVMAPACLLLVLLTTHGKKVVAPPVIVHSPVVTTAEPPAEVPTPVAPAPPIVHPRHRVAKPPEDTGHDAASLIRIETPDPDVVILLIGG